ncbi:hypothetical protein M9458_022750, partial [Cirrhinus mrigala]
WDPTTVPTAGPTTPPVLSVTHQMSSLKAVSSMPAQGITEEPPSMFSASMAPRDRGTPEAYPTAEAIAVVPPTETISDMEATTTAIDYDISPDKDSSLVQGVPLGVDNYFPSQPPPDATTPDMTHYSDSFFSIQLPRQPTAGNTNSVMDTPHGESSGAEGISSGDTVTPESVIPASPVFITNLQGDPDKPKIVYKENETTTNMTDERLDLAESTLTTFGDPKHGQQTNATKDSNFPQGINLLILNLSQRNQS